MPPGLRFLPAPLSEDAPNYDVNAMVDFWVPQALDRFPPDIPIFNLIARLRDGVTVDRARAEITAIAANQALARPSLAGMTATVEPVRDALNRASAPLILPLFGAALCVLVIACANAGALQLARGLRRQSEMAIHAALGASRVRLAGQALLEHAIVGVFGGAIGTGLASVTLSRCSPPRRVVIRHPAPRRRRPRPAAARRKRRARSDHRRDCPDFPR